MIELYQRETCPHCTRVRGWLGAHNLTYVVRSVPKLGTERRDLAELGLATAEVPVLKDGDTIIQGSEKIFAHLEAHYGRPGFGDPSYGLTRRFPASADFAALREATVAALATQGFGVLTEIDVRATMKKKLDVDFPPYVILGACNPPLAHAALTAEPPIGLLLPCNVVVASDPDGSHAVSAVDPGKMLSVVGRDDLEDFAKDVGQRLRKALAAIEI